jgi:hypothetical protein
MSEFKNPNEQKVKIIIEKDEDYESLRAENTELAKKLEQVVSIEFAKQCQQHGLDPSSTTPEELEAYKRVKKEKDVYGHEPPRGGDSVPLYSQGENKIVTKFDIDAKNQNVNALDFNSEQELILGLNSMAKEGNVSAKRALSELTRKFLKQNNGNLELEFQGETKHLLKHDIPITDNMPIEAQNAAKKRNAMLLANRTNWTQI